MPTAVVTGGTAGIGKAIVHEFASKGWAVGVIARDKSRLATTENDIRQLFGVPVLCISADVADSDAVYAAAQRFEMELGPIVVWVNNAMVSVVGSMRNIPPDEVRRVTDVTYYGTVYGTSAALKFMTPRNRGTIVQISSGLGIRAGPLQAPYCGAKAAVQGYTDALRSELLHEKLDGIQLTVAYLPSVNTIQPYWTRNHTGNKQVIPDPLYDPRLVAKAVMYVSEHRRREVWIGLPPMEMAVGQALAPAYMDKKIASFWDTQLDKTRSPPNPEGNLFKPVEGPASIDGESVARTKSTKSLFITSRGRNVVVVGVCSLAILGAMTVVAGVFKYAGFELPTLQGLKQHTRSSSSDFVYGFTKMS